MHFLKTGMFDFAQIFPGKLRPALHGESVALQQHEITLLLVVHVS